MKMANNVDWSAAQKSIINRKSEGPPRRTHSNRSAVRTRSAKRSKNWRARKNVFNTDQYLL